MLLIFTNRNNFCSLKMNLNSSRLCRLCIKPRDDLVNIYDSFQDSTIASVLSQHFWFKVTKNDGFPDFICEICWMKTKTFHDFYKEVESTYLNYSLNFYSANLTKKERNYSSVDRTLEPNRRAATSKHDVTVIECERSQSPAEMNENCDFNDDYSSEQCNIMQISYHDQSASEERKKDEVGDRNVSENEVPKSDECSSSNEEDDLDDNPQESDSDTIDRSTIEEGDAQIREFCNMKCEICGDPKPQFETFKQIRKHYRCVHKIIGYVTCCGNKYNRRGRVLDHIKYHMDPDAYRCEACVKRFICKRSLGKHMKIFHSTNAPEYNCKTCGKTFKTAMTLAYHERTRHVTEKIVLQCDKCDKKFSSKQSLYMHTRSVHEAKPQICEICAQAFRSKTSLRNHMESCHSTTPLPKAQCNVCGAWLKNEYYVKRHKTRQHGENVSCICDICKKEVNSKESLKKHIRSAHNEKRPHQCTLCDKAFKSGKNLKEHIATHTGEDLYSCEYCDKKFKSNANMYAHRKRHTLPNGEKDSPARVSSKKNSKDTD